MEFTFPCAQEISDYLMERLRCPWTQDLTVALQEISYEDVKLFRSEDKRGAALAQEHAAVAVGSSDVCPGENANAESEPIRKATLTLEALSWSTKLQDQALVRGLADALPASVLEEQVRLYTAREAIAPVGADPAAMSPILVYPHLLQSRMQVASAFHKYLIGEGWVEGSRIPRGACVVFLGHMVRWGTKAQVKYPCRVLREWHATRFRNPSEKVAHCSGGAKRLITQWTRRQRVRWQQGRPVHCPWLRQALYEWFMAMRYSIDWNAVRGSFRSGEDKKCLARFTRQLVRQKAQQLLTDYFRECLLRGQEVRGAQLTARWFSNWEADYGLRVRKANRKHKVPRAVMAERLEVGWLNVARVRALRLACHGYDPHMENWGQSPFHHNESGSQSLHTLAVAGANAPLLEGHADARERWTGNFTTFSDTARLMSEGPPYCEFTFKAIGETLELRLREYIRSRGFGPWVSVATSEKGSHRTEDALSFLERRLPLQSQSRQWRIIMADDFSAHLSPLAFRLCWARGCAFLAHGGGVTPVVQTPDADLNQH